MVFTPDRLVYSLKGHLFVCGSSERLDVSRSLHLDDEHPALVPIRLFTQAHGLVLATERQHEMETMGCALRCTYVTPKARLSGDFPESAELDGFTDQEVSDVGKWAWVVIEAAGR